MAHIQLNREAAAKIGVLYGLHTTEATADFLGVPIEHVRYVCEEHGYPSDEFIAACLLRIAVRFDYLFDVVDDEELVTAA